MMIIMIIFYSVSKNPTFLWKKFWCKNFWKVRFISYSYNFLEKKKKEEANKPYVFQKINKKVKTKQEENQKLFNYEIKLNPKFLQLNLLAEKSKNKFFNLILDELKHEPKTINERMGLAKPKNNYPKNLESLRMHMGLNSKIRIDSDYKEILKKPERRRNSIYQEGLDSGVKKANSISNKIDISAYNYEINIFQEYIKIKSHFKPQIKRQNTENISPSVKKQEKSFDVNYIGNIKNQIEKSKFNIF